MNTQAFGSNIGGDTAMFSGPVASDVIDRPPEPVKAPAPYQGPRVRIVLEDNDQIPPTGQFFGHNGRGFILRSGEAADVPPEIIDILNHAQWDAPIVDEQTRQIIGYRRRLRFPYRMLKPGEEA